MIIVIQVAWSRILALVTLRDLYVVWENLTHHAFESTGRQQSLPGLCLNVLFSRLFAQSPPKPLPYTKNKSPSPNRDSSLSGQTPPPVPWKRRGSQYSTVGQLLNSSERDKTPPLQSGNPSSHIYANQTQPIAMPRTRTGTSPSSCKLPWQPHPDARLPRQPWVAALI